MTFTKESNLIFFDNNNFQRLKERLSRFSLLSPLPTLFDVEFIGILVIYLGVKWMVLCDTDPLFYIQIIRDT